MQITPRSPQSRAAFFGAVLLSLALAASGCAKKSTAA